MSGALMNAAYGAAVGALAGSMAGYGLLVGAGAGAALVFGLDSMGRMPLSDAQLQYAGYTAGGALAGSFLAPGDMMYLLGGAAAGAGAAYYMQM